MGGLTVGDLTVAPTYFSFNLLFQAELLAGLHGTVAFKDFILSRGYRMPRVSEEPDCRTY